MRAFLVVAVLTGACFDPRPQTGAPCANGACPTPLVCSPATNTCERTPIDAPLVDASVMDVLDAAADAPGDASVIVDAPVDAATPRVATGLLARWDFAEGTGTTVADTSGVGAALNLTITGAVTWLPGALRIDADSIVASAGPATKINTAVTVSSAITVEAWVVPANLTQAGPARIITCSVDTTARNFQLAQDAAAYNGRFRTTTTGVNGGTITGGVAALALTHVVMTRNVAGERRLFVNGAQVAMDALGGDVTNWDASFRIAIANEFTRDRDWLGELHLVAVYGRALSATEITQNFVAGALAN